MAPFWLSSLVGSHPFKRDIIQGVTSSALATQWANPSDILSVLLLLGPDIVKKAVAAQTGRAITPVAFSFGWVAYAASALMDTFGDGKLMPDPDVQDVLVLGADTGHTRTSSSWVLGRLLRDITYEVDEEMRRAREEQHVPPPDTVGDAPFNENRNRKPAGHAQENLPKSWESLRVSVYSFKEIPSSKHGIPSIDLVWISSVIVILLQLLLAIAPWVRWREWDVFFVTSVGTVLALVQGSLPRWRAEKWATTRNGGATVAITQGNGSRQVVLIENDRKGRNGLDIEILARNTRLVQHDLPARVASAILAILWIMLLITVAGMRNHTWFLLGIGLLGSIQNLHAAGAVRKPNAHGFHIVLKDIITAKNVRSVLQEVEKRYPLVGLTLLDNFFPASLRVNTPEEKEFWGAAMKRRMEPNRYGHRVDMLDV